MILVNKLVRGTKSIMVRHAVRRGESASLKPVALQEHKAILIRRGEQDDDTYEPIISLK